MLGDKLREVRQSRQLSLAEVAAEASISTATLSRIERDKQTLDLTLFLTLSTILKVPPSEFFDQPESANGSDPLVTRIASMKSRERTELWRNLSSTNLHTPHKETKRGSQDMSLQVEELLAQSEFLRSEIEAVQKSLKRR